MKTLIWSTTFERILERVVKRQPELQMRVQQTLERLAENPFHPGLRSHKLKGNMANLWACTVDYNYRIVFKFVFNSESGEEEILLLTIGTHDEVY